MEPYYFKKIIFWTLNSSFFWNWCNANPDQIAKSNQLWLRGFVSIILNPFLRVFTISAFLKVIHAPKTPKEGVFQVLRKLPSHIHFFKSSQLGLPIRYINTPMSRVSYLSNENPEKIFFENFSKKIFFQKFSKIFFSGFSLLS